MFGLVISEAWVLVNSLFSYLCLQYSSSSVLLTKDSLDVVGLLSLGSACLSMVFLLLFGVLWAGTLKKGYFLEAVFLIALVFHLFMSCAASWFGSVSCVDLRMSSFKVLSRPKLASVVCPSSFAVLPSGWLLLVLSVPISPLCQSGCCFLIGRLFWCFFSVLLPFLPGFAKYLLSSLMLLSRTFPLWSELSWWCLVLFFDVWFLFLAEFCEHFLLPHWW